MSAPDLRQYQIDTIAEFHATVAKGKRRIIIVAPTGAGKTVIGADIIRSYMRAGKPVLVVAHRREIIRQTSRQALRVWAFRTASLPPAFRPGRSNWCRSHRSRRLWTRAIHLGKDGPAAGRTAGDRRSPTTARPRPIARSSRAYPDAVLLGLTATPCRGDGRGLGSIFEVIIECPQVAELIEQGYLVKTRVYAPVDPDLKGVKTVAGDYVENQLADRMDQPKLVGDIVTHWHKYGERRPTVAFAVSVSHSVHIRDEFIRVRRARRTYRRRNAEGRA